MRIVLHKESLYCDEETAFQWPNIELDHGADTELCLLLDTICNLLTRKFISTNQQTAPACCTWLMIPKPKLTLSPVKGVTIWSSRKNRNAENKVTTGELYQHIAVQNRQHPVVEEAVAEVIEHLDTCKADIRSPLEHRVAVVLHKGRKLVDQWLPTDKRATAHPI